VAVSLPHFLAHSLNHDRFAAWSLMLQIAAYASFLDFGLQTAVARFIAQALELEQTDRVRKLIETAFAMLSGAAVLAITVIGIVVFFAGSLFHGVPAYLLHEFQVAALVMALGTALVLPLSTFTGVLIGMHRNEFVALTVGGSRLVGAAATILATRYTQSLTILALALVLPNFLGGLLQVYIVSRQLISARTFRLSIDRAAANGFLRYCAGLTVWAFGMLLISGLDVTIVGHYQFEAIGYYAIAANLTNIFASANSTILNALLAPFAAMQAKGELDKMRNIVVRGTRLNTLINVVLTAFVLAYGNSLLKVWVGPAYAQQAYPILCVLMITQTVRLTFSAYTIALMATGRQNRGIVPAIVEALVNLAASLWAITRFGPIGVAYGSLMGVLFALPALFLITIKSTKDMSVTRSELVIRGILPGVLPAIPALAVVYAIQRQPPLYPSVALWVASLLVGCGLYRLIDRQRNLLSLPKP